MAKARLAGAEKPSRSKESRRLQALVAEEAEPTKRLNANIPVSLHTAFKQKTAGEGISMGEKMSELIREYLSEQN